MIQMRLLIIYIFLVILVTFMSGCKTLDVRGDTVYQIYPQDGYAEETQISNSCPIDAYEPKTINILDEKMQGVICIPEAQAAEYRRKHNKECQDRLILEQMKEENGKINSSK